MDNKLKTRKIYSILSVIFLGAIGSGFWDLFLKDFIYRVGGVLVKIATSFYQGYSDRLYEHVGSQLDGLLYLPSIAIIAFIIMSPIFAYIHLTIYLMQTSKAIEEKNDQSVITRFKTFILNPVVEHKKHFKIALVILLTLSSMPYIDLLIVSSTNNAAIRTIQRRLDIVRPYVTEAKYYNFISSFRMIENRDSLQKLINEIDQVAHEQKIKLPELKLYGISSPNNSSN